MHAAGRTTSIVLLAQTAVTLVAAAVSTWWFDGRAGWSAVAGGGISIVTTAFFAARVFWSGAGGDPRQIARAFYRGEAQKILLTVGLFVVVIKWADVSFLPLFVTYIVTLLVFWMVMPFTLDDGLTEKARATRIEHGN